MYLPARRDTPSARHLHTVCARLRHVSGIELNLNCICSDYNVLHAGEHGLASGKNVFSSNYAMTPPQYRYLPKRDLLRWCTAGYARTAAGDTPASRTATCTTSTLVIATSILFQLALALPLNTCWSCCAGHAVHHPTHVENMLCVLAPGTRFRP